MNNHPRDPAGKKIIPQYIKNKPLKSQINAVIISWMKKNNLKSNEMELVIRSTF